MTKGILQHLGTVDSEFICSVCHPCRDGDVLPDCSVVGQCAIRNRINPHQGTEVGRLMGNVTLLGGWSDWVIFILHGAEARCQRIGDLVNSIGQAMPGGNAPRNIRHGGVESSIFFVDGGGVDINPIFSLLLVNFI